MWGPWGFLGIHLSQALRLEAALADPARPAPGKAKACILVWLDGGPSQVDTWDPKPNSSFRPIPTNVAGIQISELLPRLAKRMDKLAVIRSIKSFGNDHPQGVHYSATGHLHNPAMQFPSLGSIVAKELGPRNNMPPYVIAPRWEKNTQYQDYFKSAFLGPDYAPMTIPDPSKEDYEVPNLSLPKSLMPAVVDNRRSFLQAVDRLYRHRVESLEHSRMDAFLEKAWDMILTPSVGAAFDLSKESTKTREAYGLDSVGQSLLLARRLVEAGTRFVTAAGYHGNSWDTHLANDKGHRDRLTPPLDRALSAASGRPQPARALRFHSGGGHGRVRSNPPYQSRIGPGSLAGLLVTGSGRRRPADGSGGGAKRRAGSRDRGAPHQHRGPVRHRLQGHGDRLAQGVHDPRRTSHQDRQFLRRPHRSTRLRTGLSLPGRRLKDAERSRALARRGASPWTCRRFPEGLAIESPSSRLHDGVWA